jgi:hypothetical protein
VASVGADPDIAGCDAIPGIVDDFGLEHGGGLVGWLVVSWCWRGIGERRRQTKGRT